MAKRRGPNNRAAKQSPRDQLARAAATLNDIRSALDLHRLAVVGAVHEAAGLKMPVDRMLDHVRPITEGLVHLENDAYQVSTAILEAGTRLARTTGTRT